MATTEQYGTLKFKDTDGNLHVLYPKTMAAMVEGLEETLDGKMTESLSGKYAPLNAAGKIALDYLYTNAANALARLDTDGRLPTTVIPALSGYIASTAKGAAGGVATLDASAKLPAAQLTEHTHAVAQITGVLPVDKGGTGLSSLDALAAALGGAQVEGGTYLGTGTYGSSNPNTLTFSFSPKLVVVLDPDFSGHAVFVRGAARTAWIVRYGSTTYLADLAVTWTEKGLRWYTTGGSDLYKSTTVANENSHKVLQLNSDTFNNGSKSYHYVGIG